MEWELDAVRGGGARELGEDSVGAGPMGEAAAEAWRRWMVERQLRHMGTEDAGCRVRLMGILAASTVAHLVAKLPVGQHHGRETLHSSTVAAAV